MASPEPALRIRRSGYACADECQEAVPRVVQTSRLGKYGLVVPFVATGPFLDSTAIAAATASVRVGRVHHIAGTLGLDW